MDKKRILDGTTTTELSPCLQAALFREAVSGLKNSGLIVLMLARGWTRGQSQAQYGAPRFAKMDQTNDAFSCADVEKLIAGTLMKHKGKRGKSLVSSPSWPSARTILFSDKRWSSTVSCDLSYLERTAEEN